MFKMRNSSYTTRTRSEGFLTRVALDFPRSPPINSQVRVYR